MFCHAMLFCMVINKYCGLGRDISFLDKILFLVSDGIILIVDNLFLASDGISISYCSVFTISHE